jgi:hypothetical protein
MKPRAIAVDWSGAIAGVRRKIWLAEASNGVLTRLECGRNRAELVDHLIEMSQADPNFVVGMDFAFSLPQWFLEASGLTSVHQLWALAESRAEDWLRECPTPFWGRNRVKKWPIDQEFRRTELAVPGVTGIRPKSVFQVYGAGAVGTGSVRGLPFLKQLHDAGFSIWPFDPPGWPRVIEIYPRLLTGPVKKANADERARYLVRIGSEMSTELLMKAASSEDAFDATVSAIAMGRELGSLTQLKQTADPVLQLEGIIWHPGWEEHLEGAS